MEYFQQNLRILRKNRNLTQKQLADALGISRSLISLYESGERVPSLKALLKISQYFGISNDELLGKEYQPTL